MPSETLHFENARQAQSLFNHDPRNLKALEEQLEVKATAREGWIKLEGTSEALERARQLFQLLDDSIKAGSPVHNREFAQVLEVVRNDGIAALKGLHAERIQTSPKKSGVVPKTIGQRQYIEAIRQHDITFGIGPAGTGKTYLAMAMATSALREGKVSRIILTRPAVEAGERLGFLPGDLQEKVDPYLRPLYDALFDLVDSEKVTKMLEKRIIEIAPLAFMRGRTLSDAFIILDEAQNTTSEQMKMFLTRIGFGSKAVVTGDRTQIDLPRGQKSGIKEAEIILANLEGISFVYFTEKDVVRHKLVQMIVKAYEEHSVENDSDR